MYTIVKTDQFKPSYNLMKLAHACTILKHDLIHQTDDGNVLLMTPTGVNNQPLMAIVKCIVWFDILPLKYREFRIIIQMLFFSHEINVCLSVDLHISFEVQCIFTLPYLCMYMSQKVKYRRWD